MNSKFSYILENSQQTRVNLFASQNMKQAFSVLQMPILDLAVWIQEEIMQNPLLEYVEIQKTAQDVDNTFITEEKELDFEKSHFEVLENLDENFTDAVFPENSSSPLESQPVEHPSFFIYLYHQIKELFPIKNERAIAESIIEHMNSQGFLEIDLEELAKTFSCTLGEIELILKKLQTLDPPGIAAKNLQECFLLQLSRKNLENSLAYQIINGHFQDFLEQRFYKIQQSLSCSKEELNDAIYRQIRILTPSPKSSFSSSFSPTILPDIYVYQEKLSWKILINTKPIAEFAISETYAPLIHNLDLTKDERSQIKKYLLSAKWLFRMVSQRNETLKKIATQLLIKQKSFFEERGSIAPLSLQEIAKEIGMHESTIARAIQNKHLSCNLGIFPLRKFFSGFLTNSSGQKVSTQTAKELLRKILEKENPSNPLSDRALSTLLEKQGIPCARRTITKYRNQLGKPKLSQRRYLAKK